MVSIHFWRSDTEYLGIAEYTAELLKYSEK